MLSEAVQNAIRRHKSPWRRVALALGRFRDVFLFCILAAGIAAGVFWLWSRAAQDPMFRIDGQTLSLAGSVRECPESIADLEEIGRAFEGRSLLDPRLAGDMEKAYGQSAWVRRVTHLRRLFPNKMEVEFLLRVPAAQVWHEGRAWLVDIDGVLLPPDGTLDEVEGLPLIAGAWPGVIEKRPLPGEVWNDEGVLGAIGVLRAVWGSPLADVLPPQRVIVVASQQQTPDVHERRRYELVSRQGAVVRWGTYSSRSLGDELSSEEKLFNLQDLLLNEAAGRPGICFDVRTRLPGYTLLN